jgi:outer membrane lipoprotein-sorting protein
MTNLSQLTAFPLRAVIAGALALAVPTTALVFPAAPAAAQTDQLDEVVTALRAITSMRADFTQTDRNGQVARGVMTLKAPKVSFDYEASARMRVVSNGRSLTMIDYEVNQLQRWPIGNSPLGALLDPKKDVKRYGKLLPTANPNVVSAEVKDARNGISITLVFVRNASAPGGLELNSWVALDAQNKRTTVRLSNQRYGIAVPDSAFTFRDPRRTGGRP